MKTIHPAVAQHVMEENEKLREMLTTLRVSLNLDDTEYGLSQQEKRKLAADIDAELSRQPEPAGVQDEREMGELRIRLENGRRQFEFEEYDAAYSLPAGTHYLYTRPAQTEQQPAFVERAAQILAAEQERLSAEGYLMDSEDCIKVLREALAAPIAQTAPQPEQSGLDPHAIAQQVREALDRQACPNAWMVIAYEATVTALSAQGGQHE